MEKTLDKIVALAKSRGFVYPGSEIYGGLANTWDYGNLGVELKNNVKKAWWQKFVQESPYNVGVDCAILMNSQTWVASGALGSFSDPLMDCKSCKERFRADQLIENYMEEHGIQTEGSVDAWSQEEMKKYIDENQIKLPDIRKIMLAAAWAADVLLLNVILHVLLGPGVNTALYGNIVLFQIILDQLVGTETFLTGLAVHERIGKSAQMPGSDPGLRIHQNRTVHTHIIRVLLDELLPPGLLHIIFQFHTEIAVIPGIGKAAVDLGTRVHSR